MSLCSSPQVTSKGSSWIRCRSKSHEGRIYHFNTLTGKAVWNLSEPEIDKKTSTDPNQVSEPSHLVGSPKDSTHHIPQSKESERKIIDNIIPEVNNQYARPSQEDYFTLSKPMLLGFPIYDPYMGVFNIPSQPVMMPPGHQPQCAFNQRPLENTVQNIVTATSLPLSSRFKSYFEYTTRKPYQLNLDNKHHMNGNITKTITNLKNKFDLRELLSIQRKGNVHMPNSSQVTDDGVSDSLLNIGINRNKIDEAVTNTFVDMRDDEWLVDKLKSSGLAGGLDIEALKKLVKFENDSNFWYIVTDTGVLLNNVNFLSSLLYFDEHCQLIIPQAVMYKIQNAMDPHMKIRASRVASFISEKINLEKIIIDEEPSLDTNMQNEILSCCSRLSEQGCHVVLLTNDIIMLNLKETVIYPILSVREVKQLLCHELSCSKTTSSLDEFMYEKPIKITIPNDSDELKPIENDNVYRVRDSATGEPNKMLNFNCNSSQKIETSSVKKNNIKSKRESDLDHSKNLSKINCDKIETQSNMCIVCKENLLASCSSPSSGQQMTLDSCSGDMEESYDQVDKSSVNNHNSKAAKRSDNENVMFEVTSQSMKESLTIKCDEWIYRFTQIMEDILTQILQELKFTCDAMPPPWTLYEATESIKRIFTTDSDVIDAANKLCNTLFGIGGLRGKINSNISPQKYMEMYSYGVYLTDALQSVLDNFEDLNIAADALAKLLSDIENSQKYSNNHDSFPSETYEEIPQEKSTGNKNRLNGTPMETLRSNSMLQVGCVIAQKRNNGLPTASVNDTQRPKKCKKKRIEPPMVAETDNQSISCDREMDKSCDSENTKSNSLATTESPKIIRKFKTCIDFEERINRFNTLDLNHQDDEYSNKNSPYMDYDCDDDNDNDYDGLKFNLPNDDFHKMENNLTRDVEDIVQESKTALSLIHKFCIQAHGLLKSPPHNLDRPELQQQAEEAHSLITNFCDYLSGIITEETDCEEDSIRKLSKGMTSKYMEVTETEIESYKKVIRTCLVQGAILKESVRLPPPLVEQQPLVTMSPWRDRPRPPQGSAGRSKYISSSNYPPYIKAFMKL